MLADARCIVLLNLAFSFILAATVILGGMCVIWDASAGERHHPLPHLSAVRAEVYGPAALGVIARFVPEIKLDRGKGAWTDQSCYARILAA
jgi:hypothetical protein